MEISEKTLNFIQEHAKDDVNALRLKFVGKSQTMDFPIDFALLQIEARRKARKKIPSFLENVLFVFPDTLAAEQASNESVARFHASLIDSGSSIIDLTAGLGIDDLTFAKAGINVTACEIIKAKADALKHNSEILGVSDRITVINTDSMEFLSSEKRHFDAVFADPARRSSTGKRLHALSDCQPDILRGMDSIMKITERLLIKASPLLDLTLIRDTVEHINHIYLICFKGECKEVLMDIKKDSVFTGTTVVDLDMDGVISTFHSKPATFRNDIDFADRCSPSYYRYLYEPNAGIMKTGDWSELCRRYKGLYKADTNTHLFLSDRLFSDFPGRILAIDSITDKKALRSLKGAKYNVVARNYPLSAPDIAKKHSLIPGGERFLYAFRYKGKPLCLISDLLNNQKQEPE